MRIEITKYTGNPDPVVEPRTPSKIGTFSDAYESRTLNPDMIVAVTDCYLQEVHLKDVELLTKESIDKVIEFLINAKESLQERKHSNYGYDTVESKFASKY